LAILLLQVLDAGKSKGEEVGHFIGYHGVQLSIGREEVHQVQSIAGFSDQRNDFGGVEVQSDLLSIDCDEEVVAALGQ